MQFYNLWSSINSNFFYHLILMVNNARISLIVVPCIIFKNHFSDNKKEIFRAHILILLYSIFIWQPLFSQGFLFALPLFFPYLFAFLVFFKISLASLLSDALTRGFPYTFFPLSIFLSLYEIFWKDFLHVIFFSSFFFCIPLKICQKMLLSSSYYIRAPYKEQGLFFGSQKFCHCYCVVDSQHNIFMKFSVIFFYIIISSLFISQLDNTTFSIRIRCIRTYAINKI